SMSARRHRATRKLSGSAEKKPPGRKTPAVFFRSFSHPARSLILHRNKFKRCENTTAGNILIQIARKLA
ncbi:MAG TPA: hypothetical protein VF774_07695, partial [Pseudoduganella sp.]